MPRPPAMSPARAPARGRALRSLGEGGFALLVTIVLVAFLVLILVGLASFTRVETQVAANNQHQAQARQNALMALNIAVGQLQKYAGPDQRVTARADLENTPGQPNAHWTGVYGSSVAADYADTPSAIQTALTAPANVNARGSSARLLNWLVSGNERTAFDPRWAAGDVGAKGNITGTPATTISFLPGAAVTGLAADTTASDTGIRIADSTGTARAARLLVGANSVTSSIDPSGRPIDYVAAPAIDIAAPAATVPGMDPTGPDVTIGRYAWWVGDEGVKARVNLPLAGSDPTLGTADRDQQIRNAFANSTRAAVELMTRDTPGWATTLPQLDATRIGTAYVPDHSVSNIVSPIQTPFQSTAPATIATALKYRFHDLSTHSFSILSDTYAGGLKQDLSRILDNNELGPTSASPLWQPQNASENKTFIPTWGHLRSFYSKTATGDIITPQLPVYGNGVAGSVGVSPVLTYAALGFRYSTPTEPAAGVPINLNIYPLAVLWNPYANTLAGQTYEIGIRFVYQGSHAGIRLSVNMGDSSNPDWVVKEIRDLGQAGRTFPLNTTSIPTGDPIQYFRFRITCPDLAPGESRLFTLQTQGAAYNAGQNTLAPGFDFDRYVSISDTSISAGEETKQFKVEPFSGSRLAAGAPSETGAYLGDGTAPPISTAGAWDPALNRWYQSIQRADYIGIQPGYTEIQGPEMLRAPLSADKPAVKVFIMCTFSASGRTWVLNNQHGQNIPNTRWIAQGNIRAPYIFRTIRDPNYAGPYYARAGKSDELWPIWFFENNTDSTRASSGLSLDRDTSNSGQNSVGSIDATLFEFRDINQPLTSIGQLQHANLSLAGAYPSYPVGNSLADYRLPNTAAISIGTGVSWSNQAATLQPTYYDISWLLNRTLWDRFYFSAIASDGTAHNPRHLTYRKPGSTNAEISTDLQDHQKAAARLFLAGGFNINSTSEQAWRAVLGGINQLAYNPETDETATTPLGIALSRFAKPTAGTNSPANVSLDTGNTESGTAYFHGDNMKSLWQGYRVLTPEQIAQLARNIVKQVRARGPFVSLADFVNRRVIDNTAFVNAGTPLTVRTALTAEQKIQFTNALKGALQAAIDATNQSGSGAYATNDGHSSSYWLNTRTVSALPSGTQQYYSLVNARGDLNSGTASTDKTPQRNTSAFAPKFLTQGDVLSNIGAGLSARSDTFTVRAYGETMNPATQDVESRAWCEAVVQRLPDYVESTIDPETTPADGSISQTFGRKFQIISFRWLSPSDI